MKNKIVIVLLVMLLLTGCNNSTNDKNMANKGLKGVQMEKCVSLIDNLTFEVNSELSLFSLIKDDNNVEILSEDELIDTSILGEREIIIKYKDSDDEKEHRFNINIIDTMPPTIEYKKKVYMTEGNRINLLKNIKASDNSNEVITVEVEGEYDPNTPGNYLLTYVAADSSGNKVEEPFTLIVNKYVPPTTTAPITIDTTPLTGGGSTIANIARNELGTKEGKKYYSWYGFNGHVEWCATFVSWVANEAGVLDVKIPKFASCGQGATWFKARGQWQGRGYTPKTGDIIFFQWSHTGRAQHVGIVESSDGVNVYTIEGNSGKQYQGIVERRIYPINSLDILGYGTPVY